MEDPLAQLRWAGPGVGTADVDVGLALMTQRCAAFRARRGHDELALVPGTQIHHRTEDFGDDVAGLADHGVPDQHALAAYLIGVVQRRQRDRGSRHSDWLHERERGDPPGTTDVDPDVQQLGGGLLRGVLEGDRPARRPGGRAQPALRRHLVDFHDHAVDLVLHIVAMLAPVGDVCDQLINRGQQPGALGDRQSPGAQGLVRLRLTHRFKPAPATQAVAEHPQRTGRGDPRVLLPQRACCGVARIGEGRFAGLDERCVELGEIGEPEEHLAPHLEQFRHWEVGAGVQPVGDDAHGTYVE